MEYCSLIHIAVDSPVYRLCQKAFRTVPEDLYVPSECVQDMEEYLVSFLVSGRPPRRYVLERFKGGLTTAKLVRSFTPDIVDAMLEKTKQVTEEMLQEVAESMPPEHLPDLMASYQAAWVCEFARLTIQIMYVMLRPRE